MDDRDEPTLAVALGRLVDGTPPPLGLFAAVQRRAVRRRRMRLTATTVGAAAAIGAVTVTRRAVVLSDGGDTGTVTGPAASASTTAQRTPEATTSAPVTAPPPAVTGPLPDPAHPSIGQTYRYNLYTHCGVQFATFGHRQWRASTPLVGPNDSAPQGWSDPYQGGP
jgi:hypothetical protein